METHGNLKMWPLRAAVAFINRLKLYALFINGKNETAFYQR